MSYLKLQVIGGGREMAYFRDDGKLYIITPFGIRKIVVRRVA